MPSPLTYRSVKGSPLTSDEVDDNFRHFDERVDDLENNPPEARSIDDITLAGDQLTFEMSDATNIGPLTVPTVQFNDRGTWAPLTLYAKYDTFTKDGSYYLVIFAHTSAATFDPGANNGLGQDYYRAMFSNPDTLDDLADVVTGGTDGTADGDALIWDAGLDKWINGTPRIDGTQVTFSHSTDGTLASANVSDAIEEVEARAAAIAADLGSINALDVAFTPTTDSAITATNVSDALEELEAESLQRSANLSDLASASTARTNLGVAIGTDVQAYDAQLSSLVRQNSQSTAYTTVLADGGKHIYHPSTDNNPRTFTIDSNANVAYPIGTTLTFVNEINTVTIAITSDTLTLAGAGSTGSRTLAANGIATALKVASTKWLISGTGLT